MQTCGSQMKGIKVMTYNSDATPESQDRIAPNWDLAYSLWASGLNILPVEPLYLSGGQRKPPIKWTAWKDQEYPWFTRLKKFWARFNPHGIFIVCGETSRNLEVLDYDHEADTHFKKMRVLFLGLPIVKTPKGYHVFWRWAGQHRQAGEVLARTEKGEVLIETRGHGQLVQTVGSPHYCHPSGKTYSMLAGSLLEIPEISDSRRLEIISAARGFDRSQTSAASTAALSGGGREGVCLSAGLAADDLRGSEISLGSTSPAESSSRMPPSGHSLEITSRVKTDESRSKIVSHEARTAFTEPTERPEPRLPDGFEILEDETPADAWARQASWADILEPLGFDHVGESNGWELWRKPGSVSDTNHISCGDHIMVCHSTACRPLVAGKRYSKFAVLALLHFDADMKAAAKWLRLYSA